MRWRGGNRPARASPALSRLRERACHADFIFTYLKGICVIADTDMTGSAVAAFCAAGVGPGDPDLDRAFALLHTLQDPATGGFVAPPESFGIGVNTDTTAWVASGLIQCGIDPQGPEWTTTQGKTPLDYLVSMQRPDGHFDWTAEYAGGAFETYSAVRPLDGVGFSSPAPPRLDGASPAVRPAAAVADGTTVPITLVIDHGPGAADVRMCRVDVASGSDLGAVLADAEASSVPAGCVSEFQTEQGDGGVRLASRPSPTATQSSSATAPCSPPKRRRPRGRVAGAARVRPAAPDPPRPCRRRRAGGLDRSPRGGRVPASRRRARRIVGEAGAGPAYRAASVGRGAAAGRAPTGAARERGADRARRRLDGAGRVGTCRAWPAGEGAPARRLRALRPGGRRRLPDRPGGRL
jgi:hypothetical protein